MKCIIPGANVKVFGRAIHSLSKIGEELYIEALEHGLALRTVNSSRSAYACFVFSPSFFLFYTDDLGDTASNTSEDEILKYKINMKSCLTVFKSLSSLEKTVEKCKIKLDVKEARLIFQLYCRHGIVKTHNLAFIECETLQAVFSKEMCPNIITAQTKLLCDAVLNFQSNQNEVSLSLDPLKMRLKNYVADESDMQKAIHTEVSLEPDEFESYQVGVDTSVTFCLKELRAILAFSEPSNLPIAIHFETPGKPIVLTMDTDPSFEANFVLATLADKDSTLSATQRASQSVNASQRILNTTSFSESRPAQKKQVPKRHSSSSKSDFPRRKESTSVHNNNNKVPDKPGPSTSGAALQKKTNHAPNAGGDFTPANHHSSMDVDPPPPLAPPPASLRHSTAKGAGESTLQEPEMARLFGAPDDMDDDDEPCSPIIPVQTSKLKNQSSMFASVVPEESDTDDESTEIPGTPPRKRQRSLFSSLLSQSTTSGSQVQKPQYKVLAADTDDDDSD